MLSTVEYLHEIVMPVQTNLYALLIVAIPAFMGLFTGAMALLKTILDARHLRDLINERDNTIEKLIKRIDIRDVTIGKLEYRIDRMEEDLRDRDATIQSLQAALAELRAERR